MLPATYRGQRRLCSSLVPAGRVARHWRRSGSVTGPNRPIPSESRSRSFRCSTNIDKLTGREGRPAPPLRRYRGTPSARNNGHFGPSRHLSQDTQRYDEQQDRDDPVETDGGRSSEVRPVANMSDYDTSHVGAVVAR